MTGTGTLSRLINQRPYTREEEIVLSYFFTNTDKNVYCAKDSLPSQVWTFLMGQYSRSHLSLRDRFLAVIADQQKAFDEGKITKEDFVSLEELAESIEKNDDKRLQYFHDRAASFLKKWGVQYGHNSLKDSDYIRFAVEGVSEVLTKIIESPYPTLGAFQETSTRYMPFTKEHIIFPPEMERSNYGEEIKDVLYELFDVYEKSLPVVKQVLLDNGIFKREEFTSDGAFNTTINTKVFDICRYLLPSATATKLGCLFQTRTVESHLSYMLSHPLEEARIVAKAIWEEAVKVSPGLLSHVGENQYEIERTNDLDEWTAKHFNKSAEEVRMFRGITENDRVKLIDIGDLDNDILASILFEYSRKNGMSFEECRNEVRKMDQTTKEDLMETALGKRGKFDRMPRSLQHTTVTAEFLMDFGAYRDIQRHRATKQLWQGVTSIHGYDYPEYIDLPGMEEFKKMYDDVMTKITELGKKVIVEDPYLTEYVAALGHLIRTTYEMDPGQLAYVLELRTTPQAHQSYRNLMIKLYEEIKERAPIFSRYIRVGSGQASRKEELERIEKKRMGF